MFPKTMFLALFVLCAGFSAHAQPGHFTYRDTFCNNQTVLVVNQFFSASNPAGTIILPGAAQGGIDSIIHVELTFFAVMEATLNQTLCEGDTLWVNGTAYHAGNYIGEEFIDNGSVNGCDSIIHIQLTFRKVVHLYNPAICEGDSVVINGHTYTAFDREGVEVIPNGACDSILMVQLTPIPIPFSVFTDTLCPGGSIEINGITYDENNRVGFELLKNAGANGCDSLVQVSISFRELYVYIGEDRDIIKGDTICIREYSNLTPVSISWSPTPPCADSSCLDPCIMPLNSVSFTITVEDITGCVLTDDIRIRVSNKNRVYAPTVFNPDADFPNNRFFLGADNGVRTIRRMFIADRWGELLFDVTDISPDLPDFGWDGTFNGQVMHIDTYVFWAELERIDGTTFIETGSFALIR
jgi:gliding motility-associated-like protein